MASLPAIVAVVDAAGNRVDLAAADGTFPPIFLQLGDGITGTCTPNGSTNIVTLTATGGGVVLQSVFSKLATDVPSNSGGNATLFSTSVTGVTAGSSLQVEASVTGWSDTADAGFAIFVRIDGGSDVTASGRVTTSHVANTPQSTGLLWEFPSVSAGSHTIDIRWAPIGGGTSHCDPVALAHVVAGCTVRIQEIT